MSVHMTEELYTQIRAFLRAVAGNCSNCMRRNMGYCYECNSRMAKVLGERMDSRLPAVPQVDVSIRHRTEIILAQLRKARCPLRAVDIDTSDYCSKELKHWTLNKLISQGLIKSVKDGYFRKYSLVDKPKRKKQ